MKARTVLAAASFVAWSAAGCASILGVDSDEYADAADIICGCGAATDSKESCAGAIQDGLDASKGELEGVLLECLEGAPACAELGACLRDSDYAGGANEPCFTVGGNPTLRCETGLQCGNTNRCEACQAEVGGPCSAKMRCCGTRVCKPDIGCADRDD